MRQKYDIIIIGAGIIGLATALELSKRYPKYTLAILEKESGVATHQTGHNSGVIHSGIYYKPGSHKATLCVSGSRALIDYCDVKGIKYNLIGKVVVATDEDEIPRLETLYERGKANGVPGLELISESRLKEIEPHARGIQALHSPNTGIIDFKEVSRSYAKDLLENGGDIIFDAKVQDIRVNGGSIQLETDQGGFQSK